VLQNDIPQQKGIVLPEWKGIVPYREGYQCVVLEWWKNMKFVFLIFLISQKKLSIQATSPPSERIFSKAQNSSIFFQEG